MTAYVSLRRQQSRGVMATASSLLTPDHQQATFSYCIANPSLSTAYLHPHFAPSSLELVAAYHHLHIYPLAADRAPVAGLQTWSVSMLGQCPSIRIKSLIYAIEQGNQQSNMGGGPGGDGRDDKDKKV